MTLYLMQSKIQKNTMTVHKMIYNVIQINR